MSEYSKDSKFIYNIIYDVCFEGNRFSIGNGSKIKLTVLEDSKEYIIVFNKIEDGFLYFKEAVNINHSYCLRIPINSISSFLLVND